MERCRPSKDRSNGFADAARDILRDREMKRRLMYRDVVQPDDTSLVVTHLDMVVIVGRRVMRLKVPVDRRVWMVGVRFVDMFRRERRRDRDERYQNQANDGPPG